MNKNNIWDITPLVTASFPLWPDSEPLQRSIACDIALGDAVTSSNIKATVHLGAHADAPSHYAKDGKTIDECPLHYYLGTCQIIHAKVKHGQPIIKETVKQKILAPRVLFATSTFDYTKPFSEDFAAFDPDFFEFMAQNNVITVGIDTPSVDLYEAQKLPCHQLAYKYDIALLENLSLDSRC